MQKITLSEQLLNAWVTLSGIVKNNRITTGPLVYNEAAVMLSVYKRYLVDGEGLISVKEIIREQNMLKSMANRTINSLEKKGLIERCQGVKDKRTLYVKCVKENLNVFLEVHQSSLVVANELVEIMGDEDTAHFVRIVEKIKNSGYKL